MDVNDFQKAIAVARGEALAASLLASAAIRALFSMAPSQQLLDHMTRSIDQTLNMSGPGTGGGEDELNTLMRETARFQVDQHMHALQEGLNNLPKGR
ncbi:hypothetical protein [Tardiphaga sp. 862_B3_N1_1]|uniref:hypothetical protein n=1 Tax=Tardiphaga sp. 862_B3_N1_1 TaxID=3240763 RepID=UPI003F8A1C44